MHRLRWRRWTRESTSCIGDEGARDGDEGARDVDERLRGLVMHARSTAARVERDKRREAASRQNKLHGRATRTTSTAVLDSIAMRREARGARWRRAGASSEASLIAAVVGVGVASPIGVSSTVLGRRDHCCRPACHAERTLALAIDVVHVALGPRDRCAMPISLEKSTCRRRSARARQG